MDPHGFNSFFTSPFPSFPFPTAGSDTDQNSEQQATPVGEDWEVSPLTSQWTSSSQSQSSSTQGTQQVDYSANQLPPLPASFLPVGVSVNSMTPHIKSSKKQESDKPNSPYFRVPGNPVSELVSETNTGHVSRPPNRESHAVPNRTPSAQTIRTPQHPVHGNGKRQTLPEDRPARAGSLPQIPRATGAKPQSFPKKISELHAHLKKLKAQLAAVKNKNQNQVGFYFFIFLFNELNKPISIFDLLKKNQKEEMKKEVGNLRTRAAALGNKNKEDKEKLLKCRILLEAIQEKYALFFYLLFWQFY